MTPLKYISYCLFNSVRCGLCSEVILLLLVYFYCMIGCWIYPYQVKMSKTYYYQHKFYLNPLSELFHRPDFELLVEQHQTFKYSNLIDWNYLIMKIVSCNPSLSQWECFGLTEESVLLAKQSSGSAKYGCMKRTGYNFGGKLPKSSITLGQQTKYTTDYASQVANFRQPCQLLPV